MRNLKKILALVLALIMSLSLMATAGATDFKDDESIDTYQTAIEVLSGLKVFGGDQNGNFNPKDPIRRSEVAAIIYRIATGDVNNDHSASYGLYNQFKDVQDGDWFAGYVSYCHNAGYIKGHGDSTFAPYDNVTGYQALAMILRAVGYDKNNEFTGDNWQINTASIATQRGVLKGLQSTEDLKAAASRELVAEILFRSILLNKVEWNALTTSYTETKEQVCSTLGLEDISGVVMANEYADLDGDKPIKAGTTRLDVDGKARTLAVSSDLTDIGEVRHAYVKGETVFGELEDVGGYTAYDSKDLDPTGKGVKVDTLRSGLKITDDTQYFTNFSEGTHKESEWQLRWVITFTGGVNGTAAANFAKWYTNVETAYVDEGGVNAADVINKDLNDDGSVTYSKIIRAGKEIKPHDVTIMEGIFKSAANINDTTNNNGIEGYVYAGTNRSDLNNTAQVVSNDRTWRQFYDEYIAGTASKYTESDNGEWLKVIDSDNDGDADFILRTTFTMTTITGYNKQADEWRFESEGWVKATDIKFDESLEDPELTIGKVILYTWIDGVCWVDIPNTETVTIDSKGIDYKNQTFTCDGTVYNWSGIDFAAAEYYEDVSYASTGVTYKLYLDHFGFVRLYTEDNSGFVLLTDGYFETDRRVDGYKAEVWNLEEGNYKDVTVLDPANAPAQYFINRRVENKYGSVTTDDEGTWNRLLSFDNVYYDGADADRDYINAGHPYANYSNNGLYSNHRNVTLAGDQYNYVTNIAYYIENADGAYALSGVSAANEKVVYETYAIDMTDTVKAKDETMFGVESVETNTVNQGNAALYGKRIQASSQTRYYYVENPGSRLEKVTTWVGYANAPSNFNVEKGYAVTSYVPEDYLGNKQGNPLDYVVAEVIVFEGVSSAKGNPILATDLEQRLLGNRQTGINGLGKNDEGAWGYKTENLISSRENDNRTRMYTGSIAGWPNDVNDLVEFYYDDGDGYATKIVENYAGFGIYAGYVVTARRIDNRDYIQVTKDGNNVDDTKANSYYFFTDEVSSWKLGYNATADNANNVRTTYTTSDNRRFDAKYTNTADASKSYAGDRVIYMVDLASGKVGLVLNVDKSTYTPAGSTTAVVVPRLATGADNLFDAITADAVNSKYYTISAEGLTVTGEGVEVYGNGYRFLKAAKQLEIEVKDGDEVLTADEITVKNAVASTRNGKILLTNITGNVTITGGAAAVTTSEAVLQKKMPGQTEWTDIPAKAGNDEQHPTPVIYTAGADLLSNVKKMYQPKGGAAWTWTVYSENGTVITEEEQTRTNWVAGYYVLVSVTSTDGTVTNWYKITFDGVSDLVAALQAETLELYSSDARLNRSSSVSTGATPDAKFYYLNATDATTLGFKLGDIYQPLTRNDTGDGYWDEKVEQAAGKKFWGGATASNDGNGFENAVLYLLGLELEGTGYAAENVRNKTTVGSTETVNAVDVKTHYTCTVDLRDVAADNVVQTVTIKVDVTHCDIYSHRAKAVLERTANPIVVDLSLEAYSNGDERWFYKEGASPRENMGADWASAVKKVIETKILANSLDDDNSYAAGKATIVIDPSADQPTTKVTANGETWAANESYPLTVTIAINGTESNVTATVKVRLVDGRPAAPEITEADAQAKAAEAVDAAKTISVAAKANAVDGEAEILRLLQTKIADAEITAFAPSAGMNVWAEDATWDVTWTGTYGGHEVGGTFICTITA